MQQRIEEDLPEGTAYAIAYFQDADGTPVEKEQAARVEIIEHAQDGKPIKLTVLEV